MIKVFLVEDEIIVRNGIKNNINWEANGFTFCGEASDGELAYPMIKKEKPDIVITDICMPFMDGLELSRMIRKELPQTKIIILSGHEEFEYAKSAIQIGVEEYLLKPISGDELLQVVRHVGEQIIKEQEDKAAILQYQQESAENVEEAKRKLFTRLINNELPYKDALEEAEQLNIDLTAEAYNIMILKIQRSSHEDHYSKRVVEITDQIMDYVSENATHIVCFDRTPEGKTLLFLGESEEEIENYIKGTISKFEKIVSEYTGVTYFGGIGTAVERLREIGDSYETANHAFAYRFLAETNCFLYYKDISDQDKRTSANEGNKNFHIGSVEVGNLDKAKIEAFLKAGDIDEISFFVDEYMKNTGTAGTDSLLFRQYMIMDMYFAAMQFLEHIKQREAFNKEEIFQNPEQMQRTISEIETTNNYIKELFYEVLTIRDEQAKKHNNDIVEIAQKYIMENFSDEEITLNTVASEINISPNHLSTMFSQKMGQTFVKYLTDLRMKKAKELLKCTSMRSSEISEAIGYKDPHYFSYLFKKNQGCTPLQYREGGIEKNETE